VNLAQKIFDELASAPDRPCVHELSNGGDTVRTLSRSQLIAESAAWQAHLGDRGFRPGDAIGVCPPRTSALPALHLAALASGLAIAPVNPALSERERNTLLNEAELDRVYGDADDVSTVGAGRTLEIVERTATDPALVVYTSGTTGKPKSVPLSHANLLYDLEALSAAWGRTREDRFLHLLPAHHFHGLVLATYGSLLCGCEIHLLPRFDARSAIDAIAKHEITLVMGVPTMYARILEAASPDDDLSGLRLAVSGSAPLGRSTWTRFRERFGVELVERYGLTETGIVSTNPPGAAKPGSVGKPLKGTRIAIAEDGVFHEGSDGTVRVRGEVCIKGPSVTAGYGNAPDANREAFSEGWFKTGDVGYFDDRGYLVIDGRLKELIIVGGSNVLPGEVEHALEEVTGVRELAAAGIPDPDLGEIVAVFVVLGSETDRETVRAELERTAERDLAPYKRPRRYVFVEELPRNAMGKIDRAALSAA
jgi:malonyl-CoA/methylmalonyl-CoA synthetase